MKIAVLFDNLGPYHKARLREASMECDLLAVEFGAVSGEYAWANDAIEGVRHAVVNPGGPSHAMAVAEFRTRLAAILGEFKPDAVAIPGWASTGAYLAFEWCVRNKRPAIMMSDSTAWDERRVAWKEWIKSRVVGLASSALVGGSSHAGYITQLGMPADRISLGYDVVDNEYFRKGRDAFKHAYDLSPTARDADESACRGSAAWDEVGRMYKSDPTPYFLASNRFITKKNLFRLVEAYAMYVQRGQGSGIRGQNVESENQPPWNLCLLGDGELKPALIVQCHQLGLAVVESAPWESCSSSSQTPDPCPLTSGYDSSPTSDLTPLATSGQARRASPTVYFPGFRQIDELPRFYAHAGAFVHASTTEQWGLVINEAMACGLPVLVSNRVGCAQDLVMDGVNGFTFDPLVVDALASRMRELASCDAERLSDMGEAARIRISHWGPDRFARGLMDAARCATDAGSIRASLIQRLLLALLLRR